MGSTNKGSWLRWGVREGFPGAVQSRQDLRLSGNEPGSPKAVHQFSGVGGGDLQPRAKPRVMTRWCAAVGMWNVSQGLAGASAEAAMEPDYTGASWRGQGA